MNAALKVGIASVVALTMTSPAYAQDYRPTPEYQRAYEDYQDQRDRYEDRREDYRGAQQDYAQARRDYERRLNEWEQERERYDRRYGYGAYARVYPQPVWNEAYRSGYDDRYAYSAPYVGDYGRPAAYTSVRCENNSTIAAGVLGALAGAVLGSNVAARNARTEGAVLGGVVGAGVGAAVGRANDRYRCDQNGPYFTYEETLPYREAGYSQYGQYDESYYERQRCRLTPAPTNSNGLEYRYVRVCPDETGRYRLTG